jgi:2-octaprenylphenol hydroxylase
MNEARDDAPILISGAGPVGSVLAALLAAQAVRCVLVDSAPHGAPGAEGDPRAIALTPGSLRLLEDLGVLRILPADSGGEFRRMQVWDEAGSGSVEFDCADIGLPRLGRIVGQGALEAALADCVRRHPLIEYLPVPGSAAVRFAEDRVELKPAGGRTLRGRLLICAEGAHSALRTAAGIDCPAHEYRQSAVATTVSIEHEHDRVARQRFLDNGPLAFLPLADARRCGIVWSTTEDKARQLQAMDQDEFHAALGAAFEHRLGRITGSGVRKVFPLRRAQVERYCRRRFALAGDAAHSVHPLAGLGMNLGLQDAAALAELAVDALRKQRDPGEWWTLRRYERWRRAENTLAIAALDGLQKLFAAREPTVVRLRNAALSAVDRRQWIKNLIMRTASGMGGQVPAAARARAYG